MSPTPCPPLQPLQINAHRTSGSVLHPFSHIHNAFLCSKRNAEFLFLKDLFLNNSPLFIINIKTKRESKGQWMFIINSNFCLPFSKLLEPNLVLIPCWQNSVTNPGGLMARNGLSSLVHLMTLATLETLHYHPISWFSVKLITNIYYQHNYSIY